MGCCPGVAGIAAVALGAGILIGGLLPSWLVIWLLGLTLIAAGILLVRR